MATNDCGEREALQVCRDSKQLSIQLKSGNYATVIPNRLTNYAMIEVQFCLLLHVD